MAELIDRFGEESPSAVDWVFILFKRWKIASLIFVIVFAFAIYQIYKEVKSQKPTYTSSALIMLGPQVLEVTTRDGYIIKERYSISNEVTLMRSEIVAKQAASILREKFGYKESVDQLVPEVMSSLKITVEKEEVVGGANTIKISATSVDRHRAFDIVSAVIEGYKKQKKEDEDKFFRDTYDTFSKQLDSAHNGLLKAENTLAEFIAKNKEIIAVMQNYGIQEEATTDFIAAKLNERYLKVKSEVVEVQNFLDTIKDISAKDRLAALTAINKRNENLISLDFKKILLAKEGELNKLLLVNEEAHPEVIKARGELSSIESKIDAQIKEAADNIQADLDKLKEQEKGLGEFITSGLHEKMIDYNMLKRSIIVKRDIYNKLSEELQHINLGEKIRRYSDIRILAAHKLPSTYTKQFPSRKIIYSLIMALFCSIASVYALETFDTSIKSIEQLERLIDLPVLAAVPAYRKYRSRHHHKKG